MWQTRFILRVRACGSVLFRFKLTAALWRLFFSFAQVLDGQQVGGEGGQEAAARAVHVRVHQLVYEPNRVRDVQHTHAEDAGDTGEAQRQFGVHHTHH